MTRMVGLDPSKSGIKKIQLNMKENIINLNRFSYSTKKINYEFL